MPKTSGDPRNESVRDFRTKVKMTKGDPKNKLNGLLTELEVLEDHAVALAKNTNENGDPDVQVLLNAMEEDAGQFPREDDLIPVGTLQGVNQQLPLMMKATTAAKTTAGGKKGEMAMTGEMTLPLFQGDGH